MIIHFHKLIIINIYNTGVAPLKIIEVKASLIILYH